MKELYLDANAHIPMSTKTLDYYLNFSKTKAAHGHPSSPAAPGREAASVIAQARKKIASLIGAESPNNIIFTRSCTEACEWASSILAGLDQQVISSPLEHPALRMPINYIKHSKLFDVKKSGVIDLNKYPTPPKSGLSIVCIHMQNEIGTIQPLKSIRGKFPKCTLLSDMSQSLGKIPCNVKDLDVDIAVFGAHKFGGPSGVGFMYLKDTTLWEEWGSGSRYYMDTVGTPDVAGIAATAIALEEAIDSLEERQEKMKSFQETLETGLSARGFDIIGEDEERSPNTTFARVPTTTGISSAGLLLMMALSKKDIHIGLGSACGSMHTGGSPLMQALGIPSDGQEYVRISQWGEYGQEEAEYLLTKIDECLI